MIQGRYHVLEFALIALVLACAAGPKIRRWRHHKLSLHWPMVPAKFEKGAVAKSARGTGETVADVFELTAYFTYMANDEIYEGKYTEDFLYESHAEQLLRSLENGPLFVRYNPTEAWVSVLDPYRDIRPQAEDSSART